MHPGCPLPVICLCSAVSRSFLLGADRPAGLLDHLRSGGYMAVTTKRDKIKISPFEVSTLQGEPRARQGIAVTMARSL